MDLTRVFVIVKRRFAHLLLHMSHSVFSGGCTVDKELRAAAVMDAWDLFGQSDCRRCPISMQIKPNTPQHPAPPQRNSRSDMVTWWSNFLPHSRCNKVQQMDFVLSPHLTQSIWDVLVLHF